MSFGSPTPIEVAVQGPNLAANRGLRGEGPRGAGEDPVAARSAVRRSRSTIRRVQINVDRERAGQFGADAWPDVAQVAGRGDVVQPLRRAELLARSGERQRLPDSGGDSAEQDGVDRRCAEPAGDARTAQPRPLLGDVAEVKYGTTMGEVDRYNMQRVVSLTANIHGRTLGGAARGTRGDRAGGRTADAASRSTSAGRCRRSRRRIGGLRTGLLLSVVVIFLLLAANFQSVAAGAGRAFDGACGALRRIADAAVTGTTLNVQSFMGAIMAIGVAVANAILLVTFAELSRARRRVAPLTRRVEGAQRPPARHSDDGDRDDRRHDSDGAGDWRRRADRAAGPRA